MVRAAATRRPSQSRQRPLKGVGTPSSGARTSDRTPTERWRGRASAKARRPYPERTFAAGAARAGGAAATGATAASAHLRPQAEDNHDGARHGAHRDGDRDSNEQHHDGDQQHQQHRHSHDGEKQQQHHRHDSHQQRRRHHKHYPALH